MEQAKVIAKEAAKGALTLLALSICVMAATWVFSGLYDLRVVLAVGAGWAGGKPLHDLFSQIKTLQ